MSFPPTRVKRLVNRAVAATVASLVVTAGLVSAVPAAPAAAATTASQLVFTTQPGDGSTSSALASQPAVTIEDSSGATVSSTSPVTLTLAGQNGSPLTGTAAALTCDQTSTNSGVTSTQADASGGVATFTSCGVNVGGTYTILATDTADNLSATSQSFFISGPAQLELVFGASPAGVTAGSAWATQPQVKVEDANGLVLTGTASTIGLNIEPGTGTPGAKLSCDQAGNTTTGTNGTAVFSGCSIDKAGTGYELVATDSTDELISAPSAPFDVVTGSPAKLSFTSEPTGGSGGSAFSSQPVVTVQDSAGNTVTGNTDQITLGITSNTGSSGAALSCTENPVTASAGVAKFSGCSIDKAGAGYKLTATDSKASLSVTGTPFDVTAGAAGQLAFSTQPGGGAGGAAWTAQPVVTVTDAGGNGIGAPVTLSIASGTSGASLSCDTNPVVSDSSGVASFGGCQIDKSGTYKLTATSGTLSVVSDAFSVTSGAVSGLTFSTEPGGGTGGTAWSAQPVVTLAGPGGSPAGGSVTLSLTSGLGTPGAKLSCQQNPVPAVNGVATFSHCAVDKAGTGYTLTATSAAASATSSSFSVTTGAPARLAFTSEPGGGTGGTPWKGQPVVAVEDAGGNQVLTSTASIALTVTSGTGSGALSCTADQLPAVRGAAVFTGCGIDKAASAYTLTATDAAGNLSATSSPFAVVPGPVTRLGFVTQPSTATAGMAFATQPSVEVTDAGGNRLTASAAAITLTLTPGTGSAGANLACNDNMVTASAGLATFAGCSVGTAAGDYTLTATTSDGLSAESLPFTVAPPPPSPLGTAPVSVPVAQTFGGRLYGANPTSTVDDVNTATGSLTFGVTDLRVAGIGEPLVLGRTYNSADTTGGSFGPGWTSLLDASVTLVKDSTATVRGEDGQQLVYRWDARTESWSPPPGAQATLSCWARGCTLTRFDGVRLIFALATDGVGTITRYLAPDGQGLAFAWRPGAVLITIDTTNRTPYEVDVSLNAAGEVTTVSTPAGRRVSYGYGPGGLLTSVTDVLGNTWHYTYDANGRLTEETDPLGNVRLLAGYDASGRVIAVSQKGGPHHTDDTFSYSGTAPASGTRTVIRAALTDVRGVLTREPSTDTYRGNDLVAQSTPVGAITRYSYNGQLDLVEVQDPAGWVQQLSYDAATNLISQTTPITSTSSARVSMTYDSKHRLTSQTDADGNTTTFVYNGPYLAFVRPPGTGPWGETRYEYNKLGELTEVTGPTEVKLFSYDAAGNQTRVLLKGRDGRPLNGNGTLMAYDEAGDKTTSVDPRGTTTGPASAYTTTWSYDAAGNLLSTTKPGPQTTTYTYDKAGDQASVTDPTGQKTTYSWDEKTLTRTSTSPGGTTSEVYDPSGDLLRQGSPSAKRATTYVYDAAGRRVSSTDPANITSRMTYDLDGNVVRVATSAGDVVTRQYDSLRHVVRQDNNGVVTLTSYDPAGNVVSATNADGAVTKTTYTPQNRVASVTDAAGTTRYRYDLAGDLVAVVNPDHHATFYTYDGAGRKTSSTVDGATTRYAYDVAGNLDRTVDPDGRVTTYTLNALNSPTTIKSSWAGHPSITVTQTFDALGRRTGMTGPAGAHTYAYDAAGNLTSATSAAGTFSYDYGTPGKIIETYPDGTKISYAVDDAQNLMGVSSGTPGTSGYVAASYTRNAKRQVTGITFSNGVFETQQLNAAGRVTDQALQVAGTPLANDAFSYDPAGNRLTQADTVAGTVTTNQYGYDASGKLASFTTALSAATVTSPTAPAAGLQPPSTPLSPTGPSSSTSAATSPPGSPQPPTAPSFASASPGAPTSTATTTYAYDPAGNQLSSKTTSGTTSYTYNDAGEIVSETGPNGTTTYSYDHSGNVTKITEPNGSTQTFAYNAADELASVTTTTAGGTATKVSYSYDGDGNRVTRTKVDGQTTTVTDYVWDPVGTYPRLAIEQTPSGSLIRRFLYGDGPVAMQTPSATYFYHLDPMGSVTELTNASGAVVAAYHYGAYGTVSVTGTNPPDNPLLFQGQYLDASTGLYDMRARTYDPATGRFLQRDPLSTPTGSVAFSPYVFAQDRPATLTDPTGTSPTAQVTAQVTSTTDQALDWTAQTRKTIANGSVQAWNTVAGPVGPYATATFWGYSTLGKANDLALNIVNDFGWGVLLTNKFVSVAKFFSSKTTSAADELSFDMNEVATPISEVPAEVASEAGSGGELAAEAGTVAETASEAGSALEMVSWGLTGVGLAVQTGIMIDLCVTGTAWQCAGAVVGVAVGLAFTVGCTVLTEGTGATVCYLAGGLLSAALQYVITDYGALAAAWLTNVAFPTVAPVIVQGAEAVAGAFAELGGAIATGFNEETTAISSGLQGALVTLVNAGYSAAQLGKLLASTFGVGVNDVAGTLVGLGYKAGDIATALATDFASTAAETAQLLKSDFAYGADEIAGALKSAYGLSVDEAAKVLEGAGFAVDDVASGLKSAYGATAAVVASALKGAGYLATQTGAALKQVFGETDQEVAKALATLQYGIGEVAGALVTLYNDTDRDVASALKAAGYAASQVAAVLKDTFADAGQAAAALLETVGYGVDEVASALEDAYGYVGTQTALILRNIGYTASQVAGALQNVYNQTAQETATTLKNISYTASQVAGALQSVYNQTAQQAATVLKNVGYSASDIASALQNVFNESTSAIANLLSAAGFTDKEISAIGGAFASFGQAVKNCFTSLFSHC